MNLIFCVKLATLAHTAKKITKKRAHSHPFSLIRPIVSSVTIPAGAYALYATVSAAGVDDITADRAPYSVEVDGGNITVDGQSTKIAIL